jgi:hypothetical protein
LTEVEIVVEFEKEFGVTIDEDKVMDIHSVRDAILALDPPLRSNVRKWNEEKNKAYGIKV